MFEWDKDVDGLLSQVNVPPPSPPPAKRGLIRTVLLRVFSVITLGAVAVWGGMSVYQQNWNPFADRGSIVSLGGMRSALFRATLEDMPSEVLVYEDAQYEGFMHGIIGFSDADLLDYVAATEQDILQIETPVMPFLLDVALLARREVERRGLTAPEATAEIQQLRDSIRAELNSQ